MSVYFISRDLTTWKIKVCLHHNGVCGVLMTGEVSSYCEWFYQSWYFSLFLIGFLWYYINRNRFLTCILKLCKENLGRWPKIIGMDVVEMALWAQVWSFAFLWVHILLLASIPSLDFYVGLGRELLLFYLLVSNLVLWLVLPFPCTGKCQGTSTGSVSWYWNRYPFRWLKGDNNNYGEGSSFKGRRRRYGSATRYVCASMSDIFILICIFSDIKVLEKW